MGIALDRVGLTVLNGTFKDRARDYLNLVGEDVFSRVRWNWRLKSGTLATVSSQRAYSLASDVLELLSMRDTTNDREIMVVDQGWVDAWDADADETGDPVAVALRGINTTTGYVDVDLYPTPTSILSLAYRYYSQWVTLTVVNDDTDLLPKVPAYVQTALVHGVAQLYYEEKGDPEMGALEEARKEAVIARALERNAMAHASRRDRLGRVGDGMGVFTFTVQDGSLH